jgi:hypothetical protein
LSGFSEPFGECVDATNNVYIADYGAEEVLEFAHGGTEPVKVFDEAPYRPSGCAVDLKSSDLAVARYGQTFDSQGSLAIYAHAKGKPKIYVGPLSEYASCAYDNGGNLLTTDGYDANVGSGGSHFAWLAKNSRNLLPIALHGGSSFGTFNDVHGIAWDGKYWAINAFEIKQISRARITHHKGHVAGITYIGGPESQMGPIAIYSNGPGSEGTQAVGTVGYSYPEVFYWKYPSGGQSFAEITTGLDRPLGVAISLK